MHILFSSSNKFFRNVVVFIYIFNPHWFIIVDFIIIDAAISSVFWNHYKIVICSSFSQLVCESFHYAARKVNLPWLCFGKVLYPWQKMKILSPLDAFSMTSSQAFIILALNSSVFSAAGCSNRFSSSIWNGLKILSSLTLAFLMTRLLSALISLKTAERSEAEGAKFEI